MKKIFLLIVFFLLPMVVSAAGDEGEASLVIDCQAIPEWSLPIEGYQLNLPHVFCGQPGKRDRAKGFHSMPDGIKPSSFIAGKLADKANGAGVYTLEQVELSFAGKRYQKSFSSMFPNHCSAEQVIGSIIYSVKNSGGNCASPGWAKCGENAPSAGGEQYCLAADGSTFTIATAVLPREKSKINTGFPIYTR